MGRCVDSINIDDVGVPYDMQNEMRVFRTRLRGFEADNKKLEHDKVH